MFVGVPALKCVRYLKYWKRAGSVVFVIMLAWGMEMFHVSLP